MSSLKYFDWDGEYIYVVKLIVNTVNVVEMVKMVIISVIALVCDWYLLTKSVLFKGDDSLLKRGWCCVKRCIFQVIISGYGECVNLLINFFSEVFYCRYYFGIWYLLTKSVLFNDDDSLLKRGCWLCCDDIDVLPFLMVLNHIGDVSLRLVDVEFVEPSLFFNLTLVK